MKVTSKPIPPPTDDRPVLDLHLCLSQKECAILRDLIFAGFEWPDESSLSWSNLHSFLDEASGGLPGLRERRPSDDEHPFEITNGTP